MHTTQDSYVRRGDLNRRLRRRRSVVVGLALAGLATAFLASRHPLDAHAQMSAPSVFPFGNRHLQDELNTTRGQLDLANAQLERLRTVVDYSSRYGIGADVAGSVYDIAISEGIEPELAFRLIKVESDFNERAVSPAGAIGLTQVMPATAQYFMPGVTRDSLYSRDLNLRVGLRYLRSLVREYHGDLKLALLVYNRGELAVDLSREQGRDPSNGYERVVMKGYTGTGVIN
jgi:soluble lytic murein transglycosylase-like protein